MSDEPMPSATYDLFVQAMAERKQILCTYGGYPRQPCPIILGHSQGQERALTYQFGGDSASGLPPRGDWKCLFLARVSNVQLGDGPWHTGDSHIQRQRAFKSSTSTSTRSAPTTQSAACAPNVDSASDPSPTNRAAPAGCLLLAQGSARELRAAANDNMARIIGKPAAGGGLGEP